MDRLFAWFYDAVMADVERRGLGRWRATLLRDLRGPILEIGAGTGANLPYYPVDADVTLVEPSEAMRRQLKARNPGYPVIRAEAEALPFEDATFETVVVGLVLCSVRDVHGSLAEIHRVLRHGGQLVFIEHVGSRERGVRMAQLMIEPLWRVIGRGCHLTRDTETAIRDAGFDLARIDRRDLPTGNPLVRAAIHGAARKR